MLKVISEFLPTVMELVNKEWRTFFSIGSGCVYSLGYMILSGIGYYWNDWHEMTVGRILRTFLDVSAKDNCLKVIAYCSLLFCLENLFFPQMFLPA